MRYVVGFMFNEDKTKVALIRKTHPEIQKGFLNGVGGKIEQGENSIDAMCREFEEETGFFTHYYDWRKLITLISKKIKWEVDFYYSYGDINQLKTTTEEEIVIINVSDIDKEKVYPNLKWLLRMCFDDEVLNGEITNI